jgi:hypothetical protein
MRAVARLGILLTVALGFAASARADIISDEEGVCRGKTKGDPCETGGKSGSCVDATCSFNDYSGGTPPKAGQRPCLQCAVVSKDAKDEATPAKTDGKTDGKTDAKSDGKTDAKSDAKADSAPKAGCSVDDATGGAGLVVGLGLLALARRDRRGRASGPS